MAYGLTEEQFLNLQPYELEVYRDIYNKLERRKDYRTAQICYILAEINKPKGKKSYTIEDFMPQYKKTKKDLVKEVKKFGLILRQYYGS
jgi:hypothetical protein